MSKKQRKVGRKTKLNENLIQEAEKLIRLGNYTTVVTQYLGIHQSTWYNWMQEGEEAKTGLKREFFERIKKAESFAEIKNVQQIQKASEDNWQASAWYLERKFPERWGKKDKYSLEHTGKDGDPIETSHKQEIDLSNLTDKELEQLEHIITKSTDNRADKKGEGEKESN